MGWVDAYGTLEVAVVAVMGSTVDFFEKPEHSCRISGLSFRKLKYMHQFAEMYTDSNWAAAVAQIPWGQSQVHVFCVYDHSEGLDDGSSR